MSNGSAPKHGGYTKLQINGGEGSGRRQLSFQAASVNIDNFSPYWYRLEPVQEYIPPFQHDISLTLPLINSYEFICEAPPGLEQADIVPSGTLAGNSKPLIAIFSGFGANTDAGFNALESAANIVGFPATTQVNAPAVIYTIDLTLYNGVYLYMFSQDRFDLEFAYDVNNGVYTPFYRHSVYNHEQYIFTIPKMSRHLRVRILLTTDANPINFLSSIRPFLGSVDTFSVSQLVDDSPGASSPASGDARLAIGPTTFDFPSYGINNGFVTIKPLGLNGETFNSTFGVTVLINRLGVPTGVTSFTQVYTRSFLYGDGASTLIIPLTGLLDKQVASVRVVVSGSIATSQMYIALHNVNSDESIVTGTEPITFNPRYDSNGAIVPITGNGTANFTVSAAYNGFLVIRPRGGNGEVNTTTFSVRVFLTVFGTVSGSTEIYSRSFTFGEGTIPLILPLYGLLAKQVNGIQVQIGNFIGASIVDVSYYYLSDGAILPTVTTPQPYSLRGATALPPATFTDAGTIQVVGQLLSVSVLNRTLSAGAEILIFIGTATTQDIPIGAMTGDIQRFVFNDFPPIPIYPGFGHVWFFITGATPVNLDWIVRCN